MTLITLPALALPTLKATNEEADLVKYHLERLARFTIKNKEKERLYEGKERLKSLGFSIPPALANIETVVGWPGTAVDVVEERLDWRGWADEDDRLGLNEIYADNALDIDSGFGHLDALITGSAFVVGGRGEPGEPDVLLTVESPHRVTGIWDGRTRRLSSALSIDETDPETNSARIVTLYLPNQNVTYDLHGGEFKVIDRDVHNLGRVLVVQLVNRPRASHPGGRSEITPAVRAYTEMAARTLLGMEVNREFFAAPQRAIFGASADDFVGPSGEVLTGWEAIMGRFLALPRDEDGELPVAHEWSANSPAPFLEQVRGLAQLLSAETAIPPTYLGFQTDNPASADAIRTMEARLVKRAERRQTAFGRAWREVGAIALLLRDGEIDPAYRNVGINWRDAATPTRSADTDAATKLIASGVLLPDSEVTFDRLGFSANEKRQLHSDHRRNRALATVTALRAAAAPQPAPEVTADDGDGA